MDYWTLVSTCENIVHFAYEQLPAQSLLIQLMVDETAWCWDSAMMSRPENVDLPSAFLLDVLKVKCSPGFNEWSSRIGYAPWRDNLCKYHEHDDDEELLDCQDSNETLQKELLRLFEPVPYRDDLSEESIDR